MDWVDNLITIAGAFLASGGLWAYMMRRFNRKDASTRLMLGLAHNEIVKQCGIYIQRGWLTKDEYEDIIKYLWEPYSEYGGNGLAEKMINEVKQLPIRYALAIPVEVTTREG